MASNSLRGHGGQGHIASNLRTNEVMLHGKFEYPRSNGVYTCGWADFCPRPSYSCERKKYKKRPMQEKGVL